MAIYLDHNATTPLLPAAAEAMLECWQGAFGNPSSQHRFGRQARLRLEDARESIGEMLGALGGLRGDRVVFTSGGTESNNLAIQGLARRNTASPSGGQSLAHVLVTAIEHPSVLEPCDALAQQGWSVEKILPNVNGVVPADAFVERIRSETRFAALMLGNNETGAIQPVEAVAGSLQEFGVPLHCDAVQAVAKIPVNFRRLGVATMSVAAHKFHGPRGIGVLIIRNDLELPSMMRGGFQEFGLRPGTECVALAVGMEAALRAWHREAETRQRHLASLRDELERRLCEGWPGACVLAAEVPRLPQTLCISFPGIDRQALVMALDLAGVACSTGSACASGSSEPSPTLVAMGCFEAVLKGAIRLSVGATTTAAEVPQAAESILQCANQLRRP